MAITKGIPNIPTKLITLEKFEKILPSISIFDTAKVMIESKRRPLVFDNNNLVGIITASDIVRAIREMEADPSLKGIVTNSLYSVD